MLMWRPASRTEASIRRSIVRRQNSLNESARISRGRIRLTGANPDGPIRIEANTLTHPYDRKAALAAVEISREIGNSAALAPYRKREVMPGNLKGFAPENYIRDAASTYWHPACTCKMRRDAMSVVDGNLKVHRIDNLRIADASVIPRVTTGNTMAPCIVIGECAGEILWAAYNALSMEYGRHRDSRYTSFYQRKLAFASRQVICTKR